MSYQEDIMYEIHTEVTESGLWDKFNAQLKKMQTQQKHKWKTPAEKWEYALLRVEGWNPNNN